MTAYQMAAKYSTVGVFTRMAIREENKASAEDRALARAQAEGTQAYKIGHGRWVATSTSQPGTVYEVSVNGTVRESGIALPSSSTYDVSACRMR